MLALLSSWFQVRPRERTMVVLVALLFALVETGRGLGGNAADALFFLRFGVEFLPYMFMLLGVITFIITLSYTLVLSRVDKNLFYVGSFGLFALLILIERAAIIFDLPFFYPVLWITINSVGTILGLHV